MRAADETEVIQSGFIWDNLPLVEKEMDAIDFTRLRHAVKINKFPGLRHLNRYTKNICTCNIHTSTWRSGFSVVFKFAAGSKIGPPKIEGNVEVLDSSLDCKSV
jgi:hypothetical protein